MWWTSSKCRISICASFEISSNIINRAIKTIPNHYEKFVSIGPPINDVTYLGGGGSHLWTTASFITLLGIPNNKIGRPHT